jgi:hypothetical protein
MHESLRRVQRNCCDQVTDGCGSVSGVTGMRTAFIVDSTCVAAARGGGLEFTPLLPHYKPTAW